MHAIAVLSQSPRSGRGSEPCRGASRQCSGASSFKQLLIEGLLCGILQLLSWNDTD